MKAPALLLRQLLPHMEKRGYGCRAGVGMTGGGWGYREHRAQLGWWGTEESPWGPHFPPFCPASPFMQLQLMGEGDSAGAQALSPRPCRHQVGAITSPGAVPQLLSLVGWSLLPSSPLVPLSLLALRPSPQIHICIFPCQFFSSPLSPDPLDRVPRQRPRDPYV